MCCHDHGWAGCSSDSSSRCHCHCHGRRERSCCCHGHDEGAHRHHQHEDCCHDHEEVDHRHHHHQEGDCGCGGRRSRGDFDEKRVVDLIVGLVAERVERMLLRILHEHGILKQPGAAPSGEEHDG